MIVKIPIKKTPYENFFVFEAPRKKRKTRVITANPNRRNTDFTRGADDFDDIPDDDIDIGDDETDLVSDDEDYSIDDMTLDDEETTDDLGDQEDAPKDTETPDETEDGPMMDNEDYSDGADGDQDTPQNTDGDEQQAPDNPDGNEGDTDGPMMDNEDYSDGADETDENPDGETDENQEASQAPAKPYDEQVRSYNLYNRFLLLYNSVKNYISKLDNMVKDSYESNLIIRTSTSQLREIEELLKDYMIFQYQNASYVKSLLFYEKALVSVQLVFNLLENINANTQTNTKQ